MLEAYRLLKRWGAVSVASEELSLQLWDYLADKDEDFEFTYSDLVGYWTFKLRR